MLVVRDATGELVSNLAGHALVAEMAKINILLIKLMEIVDILPLLLLASPRIRCEFSSMCLASRLLVDAG